ncbi:hypothetical protein A4G27_08820 [Mycobacterium kansasii]|nr:hypothetical protein A4G27_08820 [Mycobacterium kansasii]
MLGCFSKTLLFGAIAKKITVIVLKIPTNLATRILELNKVLVGAFVTLVVCRGGVMVDERPLCRFDCLGLEGELIAFLRHVLQPLPMCIKGRLRSRGRIAVPGLKGPQCQNNIFQHQFVIEPLIRDFGQ